MLVVDTHYKCLTSNEYPQRMFSCTNKKIINSFSAETRQSAHWGTYTPDQRYRQFLKSTKYVGLILEMAVICFML